MLIISNKNKLYNTFKDKSDDEFFDIICRSELEPIIENIKMPEFPSETTQMSFVGKSSLTALRESYDFYRIVKQYSERFHRPIDPDFKLLDFGCGWGRIIRLYFKDIKHKNLLGIDVDPAMVKFCNRSMHCGKYKKVNAHPPAGLKDETFDIITAFSVFSHLRNDVADEWMFEFSKKLKPGGILVATTESESFLNICQYLCDHPEDNKDSAFHNALRACFKDISSERRRYHEGEFVYAATGGGANRDASYYGWAVVPKKYIQNNWQKGGITLVDYFDDSKRLEQACFVLQKK